MPCFPLLVSVAISFLFSSSTNQSASSSPRFPAVFYPGISLNIQAQQTQLLLQRAVRPVLRPVRHWRTTSLKLEGLVPGTHVSSVNPATSFCAAATVNEIPMRQSSNKHPDDIRVISAHSSRLFDCFCFCFCS
ncbi:hypothetical protein HDV57DRAFT_18466 [Trichoderma longibrachiatum]